MEVVETVVIGIAAGMIAGLLGVGGGILFVPGLAIVLGLGQLEAEATSLLAIIPVAFVGAWRQHRYGNLKIREGMIVGALAAGGVLVGVAVANVVPERGLEIGFAVLLLGIAAQLVHRGLRAPTSEG